jgi:hypothetical protein
MDMTNMRLRFLATRDKSASQADEDKGKGKQREWG